MIKEFRVLAISKETQHCDCDLLRGIFSVEHPMLDAVDNLPPNSAINILISNHWTPTRKEVINSENYIFLPFSKNILEN